GTADNKPLVIRAGGLEHIRLLQDGRLGIGTSTPTSKLEVVGGDISWGKSRLSIDQGGSIELGGTSLGPGAGTPYIDFHFQGLTQDFNARIINDANGRLSL